MVATSHPTAADRSAVAASERFRLLAPADLAALSEPSWLIKGYLPSNAFCVLYGEPGCGKSFLALSIALSIAASHCWCGLPTLGGAVLYVAAEGIIGLKLRVAAYQKKHAIVAENIRYLGDQFSLLNEGDIRDLLDAIKRANIQPTLIVLDTLARLMVGADENLAKDMGLAIAGIDRLRRETSATVLVLHHTRKNGQTERGSSALRGAADAMLEVTKAEDGGAVTIKCEKMKDAEPFSKGILKLEKIELGSSTSLAITDWRDSGDDDDSPAGDADIDQALDLLAKCFGPLGATHSDWKKQYLVATKKSDSTFARILRDAKDHPRLTKKGKRYYAKRPKAEPNALPSDGNPGALDGAR